MDHLAEALSVASIAFACAIYFTLKSWFDHRERMAKIQQGINPDKDWPEEMLNRSQRSPSDAIQKEIRP